MLKATNLPALLAALFCCGLSHAQTFEWDQVPGPSGGGSAATLFEDAQHRLFWSSSFNLNDPKADRLFRSLDVGVTWAEVPVPEYSNRIFLGADGVIYDFVNNYATGAKQLLRSTDGGGSFSWVNSVADEPEFVTPNGAVIYADFSGFTRVDKTGASQQVYSMGNGSLQLSYFHYDSVGQQLFAMFSAYPVSSGNYSTKILLSADDGQSWAEVWSEEALGTAVGPIGETPDGILFTEYREWSKILRSADGGLTWDVVAIPSLSLDFSSLASMPDGTLICSAGTQAPGVFTSTDKGATWQPLPAKLDFNWLEGTTTGRLIASSTTGSIYRSDDAGKTWAFSADGLPFPKVWEMAFRTPTECYAATSDGLFETLDGGNTWALLEDDPRRKNLREVEVNPVSGDVFFKTDTTLFRQKAGSSKSDSLRSIHGLLSIGPDGHIFTNTYSSVLARSTDNGETWQDFPTNVQSSNFKLIQLGNGKLVALIGAGIYTSVDDGATWQPSPANSDFQTDDLTAGANGEVVAFCSQNLQQSHILTSSDLFQTWNAVPLDTAVSKNLWFAPGRNLVNKQGHLFCSTSTSIVYSVDGGLTFNPLPPLPISAAAWEPFMGLEQRVYLFDRYLGGLFRTKNPTTDATILTGRALLDTDKDCAPVPTDPPMPGLLVAITPKPGGQLVFGTANAAGQFAAPVYTGQFDLQIVPPSGYWESCPASATVTAADIGSVVDSADCLIKAVQNCPLLTVDLQTGGLLRCFGGSYQVFFNNVGTESATGATVEVRLDSFLVFQSATLPVASQVGNALTFSLGDVGVNQKGSFRIDFTVSCDAPLGQLHCSEARIFPDFSCPAWLGGQVRASATELPGGSVVEFSIKNIGQNAMLSSASWSLAEVDPTTGDILSIEKGTVQLAPSQIFSKTKPANGHVWTLTAEQEPDYPLASARSMATAGAASEFWENALFSSTSCQHNVGSFDPNDKSASPVGIGGDHRIEAGQPLDYIVRFQNTGTAAAQNVVVRDTLSPFLDPSTIEPGAASHPYEFELAGAGVAIFRFNNIQLPDSNASAAASHGFVKFRIAQRPGLSDDIKVKNRAAIFFDLNPPVLTNTVELRIGVKLTPSSVFSSKPVFGLKIYPNPAGEVVNVELSPGDGQGKSLFVTDISGRVVWSGKFTGEQVEIDGAGLPIGVLFVLIKNSAEKLLAAGRVVRL